VHAEAFGADGTVVNRLPFNVSDDLISWRSWFSFELSISTCISTSSIAATISSGGNSGRLTRHWTTFWTSSSLPYASFRPILLVVDMLKSRCWRLLKVRHRTRTCRCELCHQLLYFLEHFCLGSPLFKLLSLAMSTLAIWCRVVRSRDVRSRDFSVPKQASKEECMTSV